MAYNFVTVTYTWQDGSGHGLAGRYEWYPSAPIADVTNHDDVDAPPILGQLDANGAMSVSLLATDNPPLSAFNWVFNKWIEGEEAQPIAYEVSHAAGAIQTLDSLTVVP